MKIKFFISMHSHWTDRGGQGRTEGRTVSQTERALRRGVCVARTTNECGQKIVAYFCEALVGFTTSTHRRSGKPLSFPWWCWVLAGYQCAQSVEFNRHNITIRSLRAERRRSSNCGRPRRVCVSVCEWLSVLWVGVNEYVWMYVYMRGCACI